MAKKKPAPAPKRPIPTLSFEEIGSGITKRQVPKITGLTLPEEIAVRRSLSAPLPDTLDFAVKVASLVLDKNGIEYRPDGIYGTEGGRGYTLTRYVQLKGKRAHESDIWYAARIFETWFTWFRMRECMTEGKAELASSDMGFEIGQLYGEANIKFKWERKILKYLEGQRDKGTKAGAVKKAKAAPLHERIKARAVELRVESKRSKAIILAREFPLSASRIERII